MEKEQKKTDENKPEDKKDDKPQEQNKTSILDRLFKKEKKEEPKVMNLGNDANFKYDPIKKRFINFLILK
jgi:hypothetical protein